MFGKGKETKSESQKAVSLQEAERILGRKNVLDSDATEQVFGVRAAEGPLLFSEGEVERAGDLNSQLVFYSDRMNLKGETVPLTLANLKQKFPKAFDRQDWYGGEDFFKNETPRVGWRLSTKDVIPGSTGKNHLEQTDLLAAEAKKMLRDNVIPEDRKGAYEAALADFAGKRDEIASLMGSDWKRAAEALSTLPLNALMRETPVETMYRLILTNEARGKKLLPSTWTWSKRRDSRGGLVCVGRFDEQGAYVYRDYPGYRDGHLGVALSRS
ncbi:MAG: hypothetical protein Q7R74_00820 [bacterium]|nr:hypothetical protein [bacterium]